MTENWKNTVTHFITPEQNIPKAQDLWEIKLARTWQHSEIKLF